MELILLAAIPFTVAGLIGYWLPQFSRGFLGPVLIIVTVVACFFWMPKITRQYPDAWGPGAGIIVLIVGAVGVVSGLILIFVGTARASRALHSKPQAAASSPAAVKPFRKPEPGSFTPSRLYVTAIIVFPVLLFLALVVFL